MRQALRPNRRASAVSTAAGAPAPVGGLNARDSLALMPATDAITMDNVFPERSYAEIRRGFASYATGLGAAGETIMTWGGAVPKMLTVAAGNVFDVTSPGAVGAAIKTGLTNSRLQRVMFTNTGGSYLVMVNGADGVMTYNGAAWATQVITGATATTFTNVASWKRRLWFVQGGSTKAWYLGTDAIAGAATALDLGGVWRLGGSLVAILTSSFDSAGSGLDEYIGFVSSLGEIAVYRGSDPASATTFALVGTFRIGSPVGTRFFAQMGGDMALITTDGVVSLMQSMQVDRSGILATSVTDKIGPLIAAAYQAFGTNFGWGLQVYPRGHRLILNIPQGPDASIQYVMNTLSGAWCRYTGHDALDWALLGDQLFFVGAAGTVFQADAGADDDGAGIPWKMRLAFRDFRTARQKRFLRVRPLIMANGAPNAVLAMDVDYAEQQVVNVPLSTPSGAVWDTAVWDADVWAGGPENYRNWSSVSGIGYVGSIRMEGISRGLEMQISAFDVQFEVAPHVTP